jgi:hypothetical protein
MAKLTKNGDHFVDAEATLRSLAQQYRAGAKVITVSLRVAGDEPFCHEGS